MSFFPSPEPLSASPDPSRYERVLHRAAAGADGDDCWNWSIDDAAAFWLPGWTPPKSPDDGFAADMVMGLTTTALLWTAHEIPPLGQFFGALGRLSSFGPRGKEPFDGISPHAYCQAAHEAYAPASDAIFVLACLIPALLVDADHQVLIRAHVAKSFEGQVELLNEPLPKPKGVVLRPLNFTIPTADVLVRKYTTSSGKAPGPRRAGRATDPASSTT